jgi:methyl acetate hydrolase
MIDDSALAAAFAAANLPGAVALLTDREGVTYTRAFGERDAVTGAAMAEDTVFQIASMTKAVTSVGALQLVEQGKLSLDAPIGAFLPDLAAPQVLTGFGADGQPQLRPAARPITLRHLLTHTAGFGYFFLHAELLQYFGAVGMPDRSSLDSIRLPLLFDPSERWEYSIATDWVGQAIEAVTGQRLGAHLTLQVFEPLGMNATAFRDELPAGAAQVHARLPGGGFAPNPAYLGGGQFDMGGGGLTSTAPDYARFMRMVLNGGSLDGAQVLQPETVTEMLRN